MEMIRKYVRTEDLFPFILSTSGMDPRGSNSYEMIYNLVQRIPEEWSHRLIKKLVLKIYEKLYDEGDSVRRRMTLEDLNDLKYMIQRTMNLYLEGDGRLTPITPAHTTIPKQKDFIEEKLEEFGFNNTLRDFIEATRIYREGERGSIALLRDVFEGLARELVTQFSGTVSNMSNNLEYLESKQVLKDTPLGSDQHLERNFSKKLYGMLSHYGSHPNEITENIVFTLFLETTIWISFLLKRYFDLI